MVQFLFAFLFGSLALLLLMYGVVRQTQQGDEPLSPGRRAAVAGGLAGALAVLFLVMWWSWFAPPA